MAKFKYRLDTNYAKIDRIKHQGIESFKTEMLNKVIGGKSIKTWGTLIQNLPTDVAEDILNQATKDELP